MKKVLVTGASGFLGGWVVECFQHSGVPVRAGIRQWTSAVRLVRRPVEIVLCDVLSREQLREALEGCDAVVHCAVGDEKVTVAGTRNVLAMAHELGLDRVIHISSVAVYGDATGLIRETRSRRSNGDSYAKNKVAAEQICEEFIDRGVPVVLLRPTIIYGPFGQTWTVSFATRLQSGKWGTFGPSGEGKCNLVYVTDVVQAIYRALISNDAPGETFNINGDDVITWNEYFVKFNNALNRAPLRDLRTWPIALRARLLAPIRAAGRYALSHHSSSLMKLHTKSSVAAKCMKAAETSLKLTPTSAQLKLYGIDTEYLIDEAREKIGYSPQVKVEQGLAFCAAWLDRHGILF